MAHGQHGPLFQGLLRLGRRKRRSGLQGCKTGYLILAFAQEVAPSLTLQAALGYTRFSSGAKNNFELASVDSPNFVDYGLGVVYDFSAGLSLYGGG